MQSCTVRPLPGVQAFLSKPVARPFCLQHRGFHKGAHSFTTDRRVHCCTWKASITNEVPNAVNKVYTAPHRPCCFSMMRSTRHGALVSIGQAVVYLQGTALACYGHRWPSARRHLFTALSGGSQRLLGAIQTNSSGLRCF